MLVSFRMLTLSSALLITALSVPTAHAAILTNGFGPSSVCLDVKGGNTVTVQSAPCDATFRQVWNWDNFFIAGIGTTSASGKCLSVLNAGTAAGTPVQLLQCNGTVGQIWYFSGGHVVNPNSGKCLDVGNALFTPATIQNCIFTGSPPKGQIWVIR